MSMGLLGKVPSGLEIAKTATSLKEEAAARRIQTGDPQFDEAVFVKGDNNAEVLSYLTTGRRKSILELLAWESAEWVGVRDRRVILIERRMVSSLPHLEKRFHFLFDIARRLDG
ncbi:MAG TPA: hypothetical protein PLP42_14775 [Acidobacteriota bacterium]|jgi:hypothetical protein|nr:hypothetical protein [Acidobacteriota bacterium]